MHRLLIFPQLQSTPINTTCFFASRSLELMSIPKYALAKRLDFSFDCFLNIWSQSWAQSSMCGQTTQFFVRLFSRLFNYSYFRNVYQLKIFTITYICRPMRRYCACFHSTSSTRCPNGSAFCSIFCRVNNRVKIWAVWPGPCASRVIKTLWMKKAVHAWWRTTSYKRWDGFALKAVDLEEYTSIKSPTIGCRVVVNILFVQ